MKTIKYLLAVAACMIITGCDVAYEKAEVLSLNTVSRYEYVMFVKGTNNEVLPRSFTYYSSSTNVHIYADIKEGENMWYEGNKFVDMDGFEWVNVHIRPDYKIKMRLEKSEE